MVVGFLLILRKLETTEIILQLLVGLDLYCSICSRPPLPTSSRISTRTSWATSSARSIRQCRVKQMVQVHKQMVQVPDGEFELRLFQVLECPPHSLVRDGQTSPHRPRLVVSRSTCPPLSPSPPANSFVIGTAVINTPRMHQLYQRYHYSLLIG